MLEAFMFLACLTQMYCIAGQSGHERNYVGCMHRETISGARPCSFPLLRTADFTVEARPDARSTVSRSGMFVLSIWDMNAVDVPIGRFASHHV